MGLGVHDKIAVYVCMLVYSRSYWHTVEGRRLLYYGVFFFCSKVLFFGIRWFCLHLAFSISIMKPEHSNSSCLVSVKIKPERLGYSTLPSRSIQASLYLCSDTLQNKQKVSLQHCNKGIPDWFFNPVDFQAVFTFNLTKE